MTIYLQRSDLRILMVRSWSDLRFISLFFPFSCSAISWLMLSVLPSTKLVATSVCVHILYFIMRVMISFYCPRGRTRCLAATPLMSAISVDDYDFYYFFPACRGDVLTPFCPRNTRRQYG